MRLLNVNFSCGHSDTIELFGKVSERMSRIEWLEKEGLCPECYEKLCAEQAEKREAAMSETHDIRRMKYSLYKSESLQPFVAYAPPFLDNKKCPTGVCQRSI